MSSETTADATVDTTADTTTTAAAGDQASAEAITQKLDKMKISPSFSIWPPTQRTRDAVTTRLIETLSTPSVLSNRYGTVSPEDASALAKSIEEDAFVSASDIASSTNHLDSVDGGIEILQVYSKEISKLVLDSVKSRSSNGSDESGVGSAVDVVTKGEDGVEDVSDAAAVDGPVSAAADDDESSSA